MNTNDLVRAWKDPDSRGGETLAHPAGELTLSLVGAGADVMRTEWVFTMGCCQGITTDTCVCSQLVACEA